VSGANVWVSKATTWPGTTRDLLLARGFTREVLARLVRDGLATPRTETTRAGGRTVETSA
jgi:hypothetical protein